MDRAYILWGTTNGVPNMIEVIPSTVGIFTGYQDVKKVGIYNKDKVSFTVFDCFDSDNQYEGYIMWVGSRFMIWKGIDSEFYGSDGGFDLDWVINQDCEFEIIGNIHTKSLDKEVD